MYYVEINDGKITTKGEGDFKTEDQIEATKAIFIALTNLPADYVEKDGKIISVAPNLKPEPIPSEQRKTEYATRRCITWENDTLTIDAANVLYAAYLAEGDLEKAEAIQALIIEQKTAIRAEIPDSEL